MPSSRVQFTPAQSRRLIHAVLALFFTNGLLMGAWVGALPGLRQRLDTDEAGIGWLLMIAGLGAVTSMQIAGRLADRTSPRTPVFVGVGIIIVGELTASIASTYLVVAVAALLIGSGNGSMGVAMNALGVDAETVSSRRVMSRLHAMAALGGFAGAAVVFVVAWLVPAPHDDPRRALWCAAGAATVAVAVLMRIAPRPATARVSAPFAGSGQDRRVPAEAWLLTVMALFFGFTEGAAFDWSAIHVSEVEHVSAAVGDIGLVVVTLAMVSIRLVGDRLVHRWGSVRTLRTASPLAAVGFAIAATCEPFFVVLVGWLLVGFGVALIAPQLYGMAGRLGAGRVLALVSGAGYAAFLTGPGVIGWSARHVGIQHAMVIPLVTSCLLVAMTRLPALEMAARAPRD